MGSVLDSDVGKRIQRFKNDLVLHMLLREGSFWEYICYLRIYWGITAVSRLPPPRPMGDQYRRNAHGLLEALPRHIPPTIPVERRIERRTPGWQGGRVRRDDRPENYICQWEETLVYLHDAAAIPTEFRPTDTTWLYFLEACLLYDPPTDEHLPEFARYGGPVPSVLCNEEAVREWEPQEIRFSPAMLAPPLVHLPDPFLAAKNERDYYRKTLDGLIERLIEHGMPEEKLQSLLGEAQGAAGDAYERGMVNNLPKPYIRVAPETSRDDVVRAYQMIRATLPSGSKGHRPPRDPVLCVTFALLRDTHDWGYTRLAATFLGTSRVDNVSKYVKDGRALLAKENPIAVPQKTA